MSEDQFTQLMNKLENHDRSFEALAQQMNNQFDSIIKRVDDCATKDQLSAVYDLLSKNIAEHERQEQERAAMSRQLDRHGKHIEQLAERVGLELHY